MRSLANGSIPAVVSTSKEAPVSDARVPTICFWCGKKAPDRTSNCGNPICLAEEYGVDDREEIGRFVPHPLDERRA